MIASVVRCLVALGPVFVFAMPASGQEPTCAGIAAHDVRLECQVKRRRSYGEGLERRLINDGRDIRVFVEEVGDPGIGGYPRLIVWDFFTLDKVGTLNEAAKIPDGARAVGFKTLVYVDKGETSNWYFDLTRPGASPLDVVPPKLPWMRKQEPR